MRALRRIWHRFIGFFSSREGELSAELESHIAMQTDDNIRLGMSLPEARRAAVLKFGGVEATKEEYRDQRSLPQLEILLMDLRFAATTFRRRPGLVAIAVLSLGIGIGATTTIFTWFKAVYLDPMPGVVDARHLVTINGQYAHRGGGLSNSYSDFEQIRDHSLFSSIFAHEMLELALNDGKAVEMSMIGIVSGNYFDVLGVKLPVGRSFRADEDTVLDRDAVAVLNYDVWRERFAADPNIVGRQVQINRVPFTVIGVAPRGFVGVYGGIRQQAWVPMHTARALDSRRRDRLAISGGSWMQIMGRLKPGVTLPALQANLDVISPQIAIAGNKTHSGYKAIAYPLHEAQRGFHAGAYGMVRVLGVAAGIVLFLAWLNVANLLIAAASARSREMSIRLSVGAGRGRILRQLFTENLLLAAMGGVAGLMIAVWARGALTAGNAILAFNVALDWNVTIFLIASTTASAMIFGLLPALEAGRVSLVDALKDGAGSVTSSAAHNRLRSTLVVGQMALSMAAVVGALLFGQYLMSLSHYARGFRSDHVLTAQTNFSAAGIDPTRGRVLYHAIVERLQGQPQIASAAWSTFIPMSSSGGGNSRALEVPGYQPPDGQAMSVVVDSISPNYLQTLGIAVDSGREFTWSDDEKALRTVIVNEEFVKQYLNGRNPLGALVKVDGELRTIVGVNGKYIYRFPGREPDPAVFLPLLQDFSAAPNLIVRTNIEPAQAAGVLRETVRALDPNLPVARLVTMDESLSERFSDAKMSVWVLGIFGAATSLLAAIGLHGTLSAFFQQRRRELGIRTALGATPSDLRSLVLGRSGRLAGIGIGIGLLFAAGFAKLLTAQFEHFPALNAMAVAIGVSGALAMALISTLAPLRRVSKTDAMITLRQD